MGAYNHKEILSDYENNKITINTAMEHAWQHIDKLYDLQTTANINRYELWGKIDALEYQVKILQTELARLVTQLEQLLSKPEQKPFDR